MNSKRRLGRGLETLLRREELDSPDSGEREDAVAQVSEIAIELIGPSPYQTRRHFDNEPLRELSKSIVVNGLIQPLVVRRVDSKFELIVGERRLRAAKMAGLKKVPVIVQSFDNRKSLAASVIENLQRQDLNPIEEARSYELIRGHLEMSHQEISDMIGVSRPTVSNMLRLLKLNEAVQQLTEEGKLDMGHARPLLSLPPSRQNMAADHIVEQKMTVREAEAYVFELLKMTPTPKGNASRKPPRGKGLQPFVETERRLADQLAAKVKIHQGSRGQGRIEIYFRGDDELEGIVKRLHGS